MAELSPEERSHIELVEEYRHEVRKRLADHESKANLFWLEKFVVPILLVVVTAVASGLVVPYILRQGEDRRRAMELKSRLIGDLVTDSAMIQTALTRYNEQMCDYWLTMARLGNNRRSALALPAGDERERRLKAIDTALEKEYDLRVAADQQIASARAAFAVGIERFRSSMILYYEDGATLQQFLAAVEGDKKAADDLIDVEHQNALGAIYREASALFKTCQSADECNSVFASAEEKIDRVRSSEPKFAAWRDATQKLAVYILENEPKLTSR